MTNFYTYPDPAPSGAPQAVIGHGNPDDGRGGLSASSVRPAPPRGRGPGGAWGLPKRREGKLSLIFERRGPRPRLAPEPCASGTARGRRRASRRGSFLDTRGHSPDAPFDTRGNSPGSPCATRVNRHTSLRFAPRFAPRFALARGVGDHPIKQLIGHRSAPICPAFAAGAASRAVPAFAAGVSRFHARRHEF
jgi:hypothetical protein